MVAPPRDADRGLQTVRSATWPFWQKALPVLVAASYADVLRRCAGVGAVPAIQSLDRRLRSGVFDTIPLGLFEMREGRALLDALGADGRAAYLALYTSGSDVAFPLLLAALLLCYRRTLGLGRAACLSLPCFDLAANVCHAAVLLSYPDYPAMAYVGQVIFEFGKWASTLYVVGRVIFRALRAVRTAPDTDTVQSEGRAPHSVRAPRRPAH